MSRVLTEEEKRITEEFNEYMKGSESFRNNKKNSGKGIDPFEEEEKQRDAFLKEDEIRRRMEESDTRDSLVNTRKSYDDEEIVNDEEEEEFINEGSSHYDYKEEDDDANSEFSSYGTSNGTLDLYLTVKNFCGND